MIDQDLRKALTQPMRMSLDDFEMRNVPTLLEVKVGSPNSIEGLTEASRRLKAFANGMKAKVTDVADTHFRVSADPTLTDALKLTRSATYAQSRIKESRDNFKLIVEESVSQFESLKAKISDTLKAPTGAGQAGIEAELRAWVRSQKPGEVKQAIRNNPDVLAAVVKAPNVLSGLTNDVHESLKGEYLEKVLPNEYAQYKEIQTAVQTANMALGLLESESATLIDFDTANKFEKQRYQA